MKQAVVFLLAISIGMSAPVIGSDSGWRIPQEGEEARAVYSLAELSLETGTRIRVVQADGRVLPTD